MRILQIVASVDRRYGGIAEGLRQQAAACAALGATTTVATLDASAAAEPIPYAAAAVLGPGLGKYGFSTGATGRIRRLALDHDVAIVNGLWQFHALAARLALAGRLPYVVFTHGMLDPWFNRAFPLKALKKRLYWPIGDYRVLRDAAAVCFTSETERILTRSAFRPYAAREAVVAYGTAAAPPPDERQRAAFLAACPAAAGRPYLLFLSRIHAKKGCDLLLEAFAATARQRPELLLVMAGPDDDGLASDLKSRAARDGLADRVIWPGMLRGDAKWGAFHGAEAFCLPSHSENFGVAVAEALACGVPVLISDQVNIWQEIVGDGAGLAEPDTTEGTARLLSRWMGTGEDERRRMAERARRCFAERFEISRATGILLDTLRQVVAGRLPPLYRPS